MGGIRELTIGLTVNRDRSSLLRCIYSNTVLLHKGSEARCAASPEWRTNGILAQLTDASHIAFDQNCQERHDRSQDKGKAGILPNTIVLHGSAGRLSRHGS